MSCVKSVRNRYALLATRPAIPFLSGFNNTAVHTFRWDSLAKLTGCITAGFCYISCGRVSDLSSQNSPFTIAHRCPELCEGVYGMGYNKPSRTQAEALSILIADR